MKKEYKGKKTFPHFLYLLPLFFVFHGYIQNQASVTAIDFIELLGEYLLATVVLVLLGYFFFRRWNKATLFAFGIMFFHLFFGAFHDALKKVSPTFFLAKYSVLLPVVLVGFIVFIILIKRLKQERPHFFLFLNLLFLLLILIDIPALFTKKEGKPLAMHLLPCTDCAKPDVYFIIADEYADSASLAEVFHFNNSGFQNELRKRGFYINRSIANYNYTPFAVASLFNMNYLGQVEGSNSSRNDLNICYSTINENDLLTFFQESGYTVKNFSIFNVANQPTKAKQRYILVGTDLIASQTFLQRLNRDLSYHLVTTLKLKWAIDYYTFYMKRCNKKLLDLLQQEIQTKAEKPRFIYTHLFIPHYPYYFDSAGMARPLDFFTADDYKFNRKLYLEYLQYGNRIYLQVMDSILKNSATPPIIILMGDHGFREFRNDPLALRKYYFMNFNAVYLPNKDYRKFYEGISGVNQFRVLLNTCFGQHLLMLKDSSTYIRE